MNSTMRKAFMAVAAVAMLGASGAAIAVATDAGGDNDGPDRAITGEALQRASDAALDQTGGGRVTDTEMGDDESYYEVEVTRGDGSETDVQLGRDFNVVGSEHDDRDDGDDDATERAMTPDELRRASDAALEHTGSGRVTDTEVGDEESYYEVEVTRADGRETEVHLDRDFKVVGADRDDEFGEDDD